MVTNFLSKSEIVAVREAFLVVRVALLFTRSANVSISVVEALAKE